MRVQSRVKGGRFGPKVELFGSDIVERREEKAMLKGILFGMAIAFLVCFLVG